MKAVVRELACLVVGLTGLVLLGIGMNQVLDIGSCASGGPYAIQRPCPEGTDTVFWSMVAGAMMWILAIMGSKGAFYAPGAGQFLWTAGFAGGGTAMLVKVLTQPSMPPDSKLGASITAAVFIPMGLVVGIIGIVQLVRRGRAGHNGSPRNRAGGPKRQDSAASTPWSRLKALNDLRSTGALTRAEFDTLKADLALTDAGPERPQQPAVDRVALIRQLADRHASGALSTGEFEAGKRRVMLGERVEAPGRWRGTRR
jgi:hypothetical protein